MSKKRTNPDFLNGVPQLLILRLLSTKPMYGYQLVQTISESSADELQFAEGCIYPMLHRLEKEKMLSSKREQVGGRNRIVYRVTAKGKKSLQTSTSEWRRVVDAVSHVLSGESRGLSSSS